MYKKETSKHRSSSRVDGASDKTSFRKRNTERSNSYKGKSNFGNREGGSSRAGSDRGSKSYGGSSRAGSDRGSKSYGGSSRAGSDRGSKSYGGSSRAGSDRGSRSYGGSSRSGNDRGSRSYGGSSRSGSDRGSRSYGGRDGRQRSFSGGSGRGGSGRGKASKLSVSTILKFIENKTPSEHEKDVIKHTLDTFTTFDEQLKKNIIGMGISAFTPIQDKSIPEILDGKDIVAIASTGTGKTAAYLIPLIARSMKDKTQKILILCPTRELGAQIETEFKKLAYNTGLHSVLSVGGARIGPQIKALRQNCQFIIGTPGRTLDLTRGSHIPITKITTVILDEADRMLDMGFLGDIKTILHSTPKERETLLFSATMPPKLREVADVVLKDPVTITIKRNEAFEFIKQDLVHYTHNKKFETLHELLKQDEFKRVLVFGSMKHSVDKLTIALREEGIKAMSIHGNKSNRERNRALEALKAGKISVVVGTDVIARGIHVDDVTHIINYDLPETLEDYIHRIGRTGRSQTKGCAITFVPDH